MGFVRPKFPDQIWDGLTANPDRINPSIVVTPNAQDWDQIAAEVVAIETYLAGLPVTPDGDKFSLYSGEAEISLSGGQWVLMQSTGLLTIADNTVSGKVSGLAVTGGGIGDSIVYLRQGRIVSSDWTNTTGGTELVPGADYYLTTNGGMSVTAPLSGFLVKLGQAQSETAFDIDISPSIRL